MSSKSCSSSVNYSICICADNHRSLPNSLLTKKGVYNLCKEFGEIKSIGYLPMKNGELPGVVFCDFKDMMSAQKAIKGVSDIYIDGVKIWAYKNIKTNICINCRGERMHGLQKPPKALMLKFYTSI